MLPFHTEILRCNWQLLEQELNLASTDLLKALCDRRILTKKHVKLVQQESRENERNALFLSYVMRCPFDLHPFDELLACLETEHGRLAQAICDTAKDREVHNRLLRSADTPICYRCLLLRYADADFIGQELLRRGLVNQNFLQQLEGDVEKTHDEHIEALLRYLQKHRPTAQNDLLVFEAFAKYFRHRRSRELTNWVGKLKHLEELRVCRCQSRVQENDRDALRERALMLRTANSQSPVNAASGNIEDINLFSCISSQLLSTMTFGRWERFDQLVYDLQSAYPGNRDIDILILSQKALMKYCQGKPEEALEYCEELDNCSQDSEMACFLRMHSAAIRAGVLRAVKQNRLALDTVRGALAEAYTRLPDKAVAYLMERVAICLLHQRDETGDMVTPSTDILVNAGKYLYTAFKKYERASEDSTHLIRDPERNKNYVNDNSSWMLYEIRFLPFNEYIAVKLGVCIGGHFVHPDPVPEDNWQEIEHGLNFLSRMKVVLSPSRECRFLFLKSDYHLRKSEVSHCLSDREYHLSEALGYCQKAREVRKRENLKASLDVVIHRREKRISNRIIAYGYIDNRGMEPGDTQCLGIPYSISFPSAPTENNEVSTSSETCKADETYFKETLGKVRQNHHFSLTKDENCVIEAGESPVVRFQESVGFPSPTESYGLHGSEGSCMDQTLCKEKLGEVSKTRLPDLEGNDNVSGGMSQTFVKEQPESVRNVGAVGQTPRALQYQAFPREKEVDEQKATGIYGSQNIVISASGVSFPTNQSARGDTCSEFPNEETQPKTRGALLVEKPQKCMSITESDEIESLDLTSDEQLSSIYSPPEPLRDKGSALDPCHCHTAICSVDTSLDQKGCTCTVGTQHQDQDVDTFGGNVSRLHSSFTSTKYITNHQYHQSHQSSTSSAFEMSLHESVGRLPTIPSLEGQSDAGFHSAEPQDTPPRMVDSRGMPLATSVEHPLTAPESLGPTLPLSEEYESMSEVSYVASLNLNSDGESECVPALGPHNVQNGVPYQYLVREKEVNEEKAIVNCDYESTSASGVSFPHHQSAENNTYCQLPNKETQVKTVEGVLKDKTSSHKGLKVVHESCTMSACEISLNENSGLLSSISSLEPQSHDSFLSEKSDETSPGQAAPRGRQNPTSTGPDSTVSDAPEMMCEHFDDARSLSLKSDENLKSIPSPPPPLHDRSSLLDSCYISQIGIRQNPVISLHTKTAEEQHQPFPGKVQAAADKSGQLPGSVSGATHPCKSMNYPSSSAQIEQLDLHSDRGFESIVELPNLCQNEVASGSLSDLSRHTVYKPAASSVPGESSVESENDCLLSLRSTGCDSFKPTHRTETGTSQHAGDVESLSLNNGLIPCPDENSMTQNLSQGSVVGEDTSKPLYFSGDSSEYEFSFRSTGSNAPPNSTSEQGRET